MSTNKNLKEWCIENNRCDLIEQWNDEQSIERFTRGSEYKANWKCPVCNGTWDAIIYSRTKKQKPSGCPYCANQKTLFGFNDFESWCHKNKKEYFLTEWDYTKNNVLPSEIIAHSNKKFWWRCNENHLFQQSPADRIGGHNCPVCSNRKVAKGFNDFETWCKKNNMQHLLDEWDYDKNTLKPDEVLPFSNKKIWWICKHGHTWEITINDRTGYKHSSCPYCANKKVMQGFNDFETWCKKNDRLELLLEWDYEGNDKLGITPQNITYGSSRKKVWWKCPVCGYKWSIGVDVRTKGNGCAVCHKKGLLTGVNDLETYCKNNNLEYILQEWDCEKNYPLTPKDVTAFSNKNVFWKCSACEYKWNGRISGRVLQQSHCKKCNPNGTSFSEQAILYYVKQHFSNVIHRFNDFGFELDIYIPSIKTAIEYDGYIYHQNTDRETKKNQLCKNNKIKLIRIREDGLCSYDDCICIFRNRNKIQSLNEAITTLFSHLGIDYINNINVEKDTILINEQYRLTKLENSLATKFPEIANEWHPTKNGNLKPENFSYGSREKIWWLCPNGHSFQQLITNRTAHNQGCPICAKQKQMKKVLCVETGEIFDSVSIAAKTYNIKNPSQISVVCKGIWKTAGGYHWEYVNKENNQEKENK